MLPPGSLTLISGVQLRRRLGRISGSRVFGEPPQLLRDLRSLDSKSRRVRDADGQPRHA
jgi:hypothetical protein